MTAPCPHRASVFCSGQHKDSSAGLQGTEQRALLHPLEMVYQRHDELRIPQLIVEGFTRTKGSILKHLAAQSQADVLLLRETHQSEPSKLKLRGYCRVSYTPDNQYGLATFTKIATLTIELAKSLLNQEIEFLIIKIQETSIIDVYKPQRSAPQLTLLPGVRTSSVLRRFQPPILNNIFNELS